MTNKKKSLIQGKITHEHTLYSTFFQEKLLKKTLHLTQVKNT